ncbi:MAG TPA: hypothetical protein PLZ56_00780 [Anaerolineae bacterium]|nr:hypothetical protein [Anaerolineae bacterium]
MKRLPIAALSAVLLGLCPSGRPAAARLDEPQAPRRLQTDVCGKLTGVVTWTRGASPYVSTCDLEVPVGSTLTMEPGVEVKLGPRHKLSVAGRLLAVGSEALPISFKPASSEWDSVQLLAGSGPSEIAYASFTGGGAGRREMLGIAADQADLHHSSFLAGSGVGVEVKAGAAPTLRYNRFDGCTVSQALPPAALRLQKGARPVVKGNYFLRNVLAMQMDASASPSLDGNRFDYNGHNGITVSGTVTDRTTLASLGPRRWSYRVDGNGFLVDQGGTLTLLAGTTFRFTNGGALRVKNGTLAIRGAAGSPVQLIPEKDDKRPGAWPEVLLDDGTTDYDPATGAGTLIEHAEILYGGASSGGAITVRNSSPRIQSTLIRQSGGRGITVTGPEARPQLIGNLVFDQQNEARGSGIFVDNGAAPSMSFNILRGNVDGLRVDTGAQPQVGPHNWFDFNRIYGLYNEDRTTCVEAAGNDWGDTAGPNDVSERTDACGLGGNPGKGEEVSDGVRYLPFEGQQVRPQILAPRCGVFNDAQPEISGVAASGARVLVYDNYQLLGETRAAVGEGESAPFSYRPAAPLSAGSHVIQVRSEGESGVASGITQPAAFSVDPALLVDAAGLELRYELEGTRYVQPYQDESGCLALRGDGEWTLRVHPPAPSKTQMVTLHVPLRCPAGQQPSGELRYQDKAYPLGALDGAYQASFPLDVAATGATVTLSARCGGGEPRDLLLGTMTVEYDGFVHDLSGQPDPRLKRIAGARVSLFARDPGAAVGREWKLWPATHGQTNPQTTGPTGWYGFYPPPGQYRVMVEASGYKAAFTNPETVTNQPMMQTIGLEPGTTVPTPPPTRQPGKGIYLPLLLKAFEPGS